MRYLHLHRFATTGEPPKKLCLDVRCKRNVLFRIMAEASRTQIGKFYRASGERNRIPAQDFPDVAGGPRNSQTCFEFPEQSLPRVWSHTGSGAGQAHQFLVCLRSKTGLYFGVCDLHGSILSRRRLRGQTCGRWERKTFCKFSVLFGLLSGRCGLKGGAVAVGLAFQLPGSKIASYRRCSAPSLRRRRNLRPTMTRIFMNFRGPRPKRQLTKLPTYPIRMIRVHSC